MENAFFAEKNSSRPRFSRRQFSPQCFCFSDAVVALQVRDNLMFPAISEQAGMKLAAARIQAMREMTTAMKTETNLVMATSKAETNPVMRTQQKKLLPNY